MIPLDEIVQLALNEPSTSDPEISADILCETALNALDQLMVLAAKEETFQHVMANKVFVGQILTRAQLVASFLMASQPRLTVVGR